MVQARAPFIGVYILIFKRMLRTELTLRNIFWQDMLRIFAIDMPQSQMIPVLKYILTTEMA